MGDDTETRHDLAERLGLICGDREPTDAERLRALAVVGGPSWVAWQEWLEREAVAKSDDKG